MKKNATQMGILFHSRSLGSITIKKIRAICIGQNSKEIKTERKYFIRNEVRLAYAKLKSLNLPIGSGAIHDALAAMGVADDCNELGMIEKTSEIFACAA
jgi:hypothetical protein